SLGVSGFVSAANSLVGSHAFDQVSSGGIILLGSGNYLVLSPRWATGPAGQAGAVTWGDATVGISGAVSAANSLVGSHIFDQVGRGGITLLTNGNYLVLSPRWANGAAGQAAAGSWCDASVGVSGSVSAANSLVGSHTFDQVGSGG